ncbi:MAG: hypothetical protein EP344_13415 [Bacteroidetes bacterium]|nr:MAG: hypothetical protein EP344_13415 [Bacteroidota bacterium]
MNIRLIDADRVSWLRSQTIYHALAHAKKENTPDTIVLSIPVDPYVCIGFHQDLEQEVNTGFCAANDIPVLRRETGGGAVYLDDGQLFTQWIFGPDRLPVKTDTRFSLFVAPLVETYKFFGIKAYLHPPNDVHVGGKKIVGTGAAAIGNAEVVTGNFLFGFDCNRMANVLNVPDEHFREHFRQGLQRYMTSMQQELEVLPDIRAVKQTYVQKCAEALGRKIVPGTFTDEEYRMMEQLDEKFVTKEWLYQYTAHPSRLRRKVKIHAGVWMYDIAWKTEGGRIDLLIRTKAQRIDLISIKGDLTFQPVGKLKGLENALRNVDIDEMSLTEVLEAFYMLHQIESPGITINDWVEAIMKAK